MGEFKWGGTKIETRQMAIISVNLALHVGPNRETAAGGKEVLS